MGALLILDTGERTPLRARTRIGRAADSTVRLRHASASRDHAVVTWVAGRWEARDLGSANGTWVDGRRLATGVPAELVEGSVLGFGVGAGGARVVDAGPPEPLAQAPDGTWVEGRHGVLDLFAGEDALSVWRGPEGWRCEGAVERIVADGDTLAAGDATWTLWLPDPEPVPPTEAEREPPAPAAAPIPLEVGAFHPDDRLVRGVAGTIPLSPTEARLLSYLAQREGEPVPHRELLARVWGYRESVETRTLYVTANRLRQKIERDPTTPRHLLAVPGVGYRFVALDAAPDAETAPTPTG